MERYDSTPVERPRDLAPWQAFSAQNPCPLCFGYPEDTERPCDGYLSRDLTRLFCAREDRSVDLACDTKVELRDELEQAETLAEASHALSSADLLALEPVQQEWLVEERLPRVGSSLLVGAPGVGRSTLARDLALSVARGSDWVGFGVRRGRVLWVSLEHKLAELRDPFAQHGLRAGDDVHFMDEGDPEPGLLQRICERALDLEPALIVIDALEPVLAVEEQGSPGRTPLDRVLDLCRDTGAHVLSVHGMKRGARELAELLSGTSREVDTVLILGRSGTTREIRTVQRRGEDLGYPVLVPPQWERTTAPRPPRPSAHPATARVRPSRPVHPEPAPAPVPAETVHERVLGHLRRVARLATTDEIAAGLGLERDRVLRVVTELKRAARVVEVSGAGPGEPPRYTGCDEVAESGSWLRRVRPWVALTPAR